jgi:hypothetical protein
MEAIRQRTMAKLSDASGRRRLCPGLDRARADRAEFAPRAHAAPGRSGTALGNKAGGNPGRSRCRTARDFWKIRKLLGRPERVQTLIGRNNGEVFVNSSGDAFLAQGGAGDVLAGFLGGLLAQPKLQAQPLKTIRFGVWAHGYAADALSTRERVWTVDDLLGEIGNAT